MTETARTPTLAQVIKRAIDAALADVRVSLPAEIVKFDDMTQLAVVKPLLKETHENEEETEVVQSLPVISNVPVQFPRAGGFVLTFPVQPGDPCLLVFSDRALDKWIDSAKDSDPVDLRRHALSDAIAILGVSAKPKAIANFETGGVKLGKEGGLHIYIDAGKVALGDKTATDTVAMNQKVLSALNAIASAFALHTHIASGPGSPTGPAVGTLPVPATVGSASVKVKD